MKKMYLAYKQDKSVQILGTLIILNKDSQAETSLVWILVNYPKIGS